MAKKTEAALRQALEKLVADLAQLQVSWALVGGLAVGVRSEPRFTRDIDIAIAVADDSAAELLVHQLRQRGYALAMVLEHKPTGRIGTVRLFSPIEARIFVDLLFAASGIEREVVAGATPNRVLPGLTVPVAQSTHLVAMKVLSADRARRPVDFADIAALLEGAPKAEARAVESLLMLMTRRGFSRRTNLVAKFRKTSAARGKTLARSRGPR